jgi:hypothetical protein
LCESFHTEGAGNGASAEREKPAMLTANQIRWASQHDWFIRDNGDGTVTVARRWYRASDGKGGETLLRWSRPFSMLRAWAGY